jgi:hypothetical protein
MGHRRPTKPPSAAGRVAPPPPPPTDAIAEPPEWLLSWARADFLADRIDLPEFERRMSAAVEQGA